MSLRCCWPDCFEWAPMDLMVPACWKHARIIAEDFIRIVHEYKAGEQKRVEEVKERRADPNGNIYYLRVDGLIKIGFSKDVWSRMKSYPPTSQLLAIEPGTAQTEWVRHQQFHVELEHGREWFKESPELTLWIDAVRAQHGDPQARAYRFTTPNDRKKETINKRSKNRR